MSTSEYYIVCNESLRQKPNLITKQAADMYNIYKHIHSSDVRRYCSVVVMSTALDAGLPGSNLFRGCFFFHIFTRPKRNRRHYFSLL